MPGERSAVGRPWSILVLVLSLLAASALLVVLTVISTVELFSSGLALEAPLEALNLFLPAVLVGLAIPIWFGYSWSRWLILLFALLTGWSSGTSIPTDVVAVLVAIALVMSFLPPSHRYFRERKQQRATT